MIKDLVYIQKSDDSKIILIVNIFITLSLFYWTYIYYIYDVYGAVVIEFVSIVLGFYIAFSKDSLDVKKNLIFFNLYLNLMIIGILSVGYGTPCMYSLSSLPYLAFLFFDIRKGMRLTLLIVLSLILFYLLEVYNFEPMYNLDKEVIDKYVRDIIYNIVFIYGFVTYQIFRVREKVDQDYLKLKAKEYIAPLRKDESVVSTQIAHEINNPLTIIKGFSRNFTKLYGESSQINEIDQQVTSIQEKTSLYRSIVQKEQSLDIQPYTMRKLVDSACSVFQQNFVEYDVVVEKHFLSNLENAVIRTDLNIVSRILLQLLQNALESVKGEQTPVIEMSVSQRDDFFLYYCDELW